MTLAGRRILTVEMAEKSFEVQATYTKEAVVITRTPMVRGGCLGLPLSETSLVPEYR